jgi:hypothetical protein
MWGKTTKARKAAVRRNAEIARVWARRARLNRRQVAVQKIGLLRPGPTATRKK